MPSGSVAASVVVLTHNSSNTIGKVLDGICQQRFAGFEVVCIDSASTDDTVSIVEKYPVRLEPIDAADFGHGKTRNLGAQLAQGEIVVFLTHDSVPETETWLTEMTGPFDDPKVAGVFGRQVPRPDENPLDKSFQASLYGDRPILWEDSNWRQGDNLFSDANSAVRRNLLLQHPLSDDIIVSEDYEWAVRILGLGYKIAYSPAARVIHSHSYNLRTLFRRNFDVGVSYRQIYTTREPHHFLRRGARILTQEVKDLRASGHARLIPLAIIRDGIRFIAIQVGKNEHRFSTSFKRDVLSGQQWYWK